ncbi:MAG TPA: porin family protein [Bacteroidales bacterium]|nr:porin family protein [Bacteroidales bacterium]HPI85441.1 porin family protein [Bacteroidales bacterium]HPM91509.1 porin family protein [Bacteroidales bacterium]
MKNFILAIILLLPFFAVSQEKSKVVGETTIRRVSVGVELFQDFWMNKPEGIDVRAINQGGGAFVMYNAPLGKSPLTFSIGAGLGFHNLYSNSLIDDIKADTITFSPINDTIDYKRSKLGLTYLDFPIELRLVTKDKFRVAVGVKLGYLLDAKTKYKGENAAGDLVTIKTRKVDQIDKFRFGPTLRIGYDWFQVMGYFSVTQIFEKGLGPEVYPISVGITLMPF